MKKLITILLFPLCCSAQFARAQYVSKTQFNSTVASLQKQITDNNNKRIADSTAFSLSIKNLTAIINSMGIRLDTSLRDIIVMPPLFFKKGILSDTLGYKP